MTANTDTRNVLLTLVATTLAVTTGSFAYTFPQTIISTSEMIITSISIFFALSTSLITLASSQVKISENVAPKRKDRIDLENDIELENTRIIQRQKFFVFIMLTSVILGIVFIGLNDFSPNSRTYRLVGAAFAFFATVSFSIAFILPFSIATVIRRNRYFRMD